MEKSLKKVQLGDRGLIRVSGMDARTFLQGLLTNDMERVSQSQALYSAFLTSQGKFSHDLFVVKRDDTYLLDVEKQRLSSLLDKLKMYKLRSDITLKDCSDEVDIWALWGGSICEDFDLPCEPGQARPYEGGVIYRDPRLLDLGLRVIIPREAEVDPPHVDKDRGVQSLYMSPESLKSTTQIEDLPAWMLTHLEAEQKDYEVLRLKHGIPSAPVDLIPEKSIPLECNLDLLNAISWSKGCYLGQELTARTKHRGLVRKRLFPVRVEGAPVPSGTELYQGEAKVGTLRSSHGKFGLALLRLEPVLGTLKTPLHTGEGKTRLHAFLPDWMKGIRERGE